jgi:hypothetical protein
VSVPRPTVRAVTTTAVILSALALVLSPASLTWQAWSWFRSGPVLRVKVANSFAAVTDDHVEHYISVTAANTGRGATTVTGWGIRLPNGTDYIVFRPLVFSAQTPARIEPHASATFLIGADELRQHAREAGVAFKDIDQIKPRPRGRREVQPHPPMVLEPGPDRQVLRSGR